MHAHAKCLAGLWLLVLNAVLITLLEVWNVELAVHAVGHPSWIAILILASADDDAQHA